MSEEDFDFETNAYTMFFVWCEGCDEITQLEHDPAGEVVECDACEAKIRVVETT